MLIFGIIFAMITTVIVYGAYVILFAFTLWMIVDAAKQDRFWWIIVILGVPFVGGAVYFLTEKKHEYAKAPTHHLHTSETETQHEKAPHKQKKSRKEEKEVKKEEKIENVLNEIPVLKTLDEKMSQFIADEIKEEKDKESSSFS